MFIEFPELAVAVEITADGDPSVPILGSIDTDLTSMLRLPYHRLCTSTQLPTIEHVSLTLDPHEDAHTFAVTLECSFTARTYTTHVHQFHWDITALLRAIVISHQLTRGVVAYHAASVTIGGATHLLIGESGAGKSLVCAAAIGLGADVLTSELTFIGGGSVHVGNHVLEVSRPALDGYGMSDVKSVGGPVRASTLLAELPRGPHAVRVMSIAILRVDHGSMRTQPVKALRLRTVLYENALRQHPISFLVAEQTAPLLHHMPPEHLAVTSADAVSLSRLPAQILSGHPRDLARYLAQSGLP